MKLVYIGEHKCKTCGSPLGAQNTSRRCLSCATKERWAKPEERLRVSKSHMGMRKPWVSKSRKGVARSELVRIKISNTLKGDKATVERCRSIAHLGARGAHLKKPTGIEVKVYEELKSRGLLFEKEKTIGGKFTVDVYIPHLNLVIECDGNYWHSLDNIRKKDRAENSYLNKCGFNLFRLSEDDINVDVHNCIDRVLNFTREGVN